MPNQSPPSVLCAIEMIGGDAKPDNTAAGVSCSALPALETKRTSADVRYENPAVVVFRHGGHLRDLCPGPILDAFKLAVVLAHNIGSFWADP